MISSATIVVLRDSRNSSYQLKEVHLMNTKQKIHHAKMAKWAALIKEQSDSGLNVRQWCSQEGYSIHAYNYWKHLLKEEAMKSVSLPEIVPLQQPIIPEQPLPAPLCMQTPNSLDSRNSCISASPLSVSFGDIQINIGPSASDDAIVSIIKAVRHV